MFPLLVPEVNEKLSVLRPRAGIEARDTGLVDDADVKVIHHSHLTRQTSVISEIALRCKNCFFRITDRARITCKDLDPARRAPSIAPAAVKYVNARILDREYELSSVFRFDTNFAVCCFGSNYLHQENLRW
jgi:hypothetical protein